MDTACYKGCFVKGFKGVHEVGKVNRFCEGCLQSPVLRRDLWGFPKLEDLSIVA